MCLLATKDTRFGYLWNPATRQAKRISHSDFTKGDDSCEYNEDLNKIGFGYDPISNDYKIVKIWIDHVEVYSSNADAWRKIDEVKPSIDVETMIPTCDTSVQGVLYWRTDEGQLVLYDLHNEVFEQVPPPSYVKDHETKEQIVNFRGSAAMIVYSICCYEIGLWVMDDQERCWTEKFKFRTGSYSVTFLSGTSEAWAWAI